MTGRIAIAKKTSVITMAKGILIASPETSARTSLYARKGIMLIGIIRILEVRHKPHSFLLRV